MCCTHLVAGSRWTRGPRRKSAYAHLLGMWVPFPSAAWMFVCDECCVLSGRGLCNKLITRPEESYRLVRRCVWSRNLMDEEALDHWRLSRQKNKQISCLGEFARLRKATVNSVMSGCPSVRPHGTTRLPTVKVKAVPLQAWSVPEGSRKLRIPDYMTTAQDGGKVVSLTHRPPLPPRKCSWYSFLFETASTPGP
jgi:hypothetical protein